MKKLSKILIPILLIVCLVEGFFLYRAYVIPSEDVKTARKISQIKDTIESNYKGKIDKEKLDEYSYKGIVAGLGDVYSDYYSAEEFDEIMESTQGEYSGIGIYLTQNTQGNIEVVKTVKNSPADGIGLKQSDILTKVDGKSVSGRQLSDVVKDVKGKEGTKVKLTFERNSKEKTYSLTRENIVSPTVETKMLDNKVGYLQILEFDEVTVKQFENGIKKLKKQGMKSLIIDLRDNPGGLLSSVVQIADDLLPKGMIVYTKNKQGDKQEYRSSDKILTKVPICVLTNENSASASEILAGAIKDRKAGTLVGEKTYGKGIVQGFFALGDGDYLKLTSATYYTPNGNNIHKKGIKPNVVQKDNEKTKADETLEKAEDILNK